MQQACVLIQLFVCYYGCFMFCVAMQFIYLTLAVNPS